MAERELDAITNDDGALKLATNAEAWAAYRFCSERQAYYLSKGRGAKKRRKMLAALFARASDEAIKRFAACGEAFVDPPASIARVAHVQLLHDSGSDWVHSGHQAYVRAKCSGFLSWFTACWSGQGAVLLPQCIGHV